MLGCGDRNQEVPMLPSPAATVPPPDGYVVFAKHDCPTCQLVVPVLGEVARHGPLVVYSQDDPAFPEGLAPVDDHALAESFRHDVETVPTLIRFAGGKEVARTVGWDRAEWERVTGQSGLGAGLPAFQPGCGS